jgi:ABC-type antimicrobial peptide transport system permease subunit
VPIPLSYSWRNLLRRRVTTGLTIAGMAMVVFVFAATLMLAEGLRKTLVSTGSYDNALCIRKGAETEIQSGVERPQAAMLTSLSEIATGSDGTLLAAREAVVLIGLNKRGGSGLANVTLRGIEPASLALRPQVRVSQGRTPRPGTNEIMVGKSIVRRFAGVDLGQSLRFGQREWPVVGVFDGGETGFSSEIWGNCPQLMAAFGRQAYSVVIFKLRDSESFEPLKERLLRDPRLTVDVKRENLYYEEQSRLMAKFLRILGISLTVIFSLGAVIGAMITMYSAVAGRVAEIGTLRALGFQRGGVWLAFLAEAVFMGAVSGLVGLFFASFLRYLTFSTTNFQTFSELSFQFALNPEISLFSLCFSVLMGVAGGFLPAFRASRLKIVDALRSG